jgi:hypothetical protein
MNLKSDAPMPWLKEFEIVPDRQPHPARNVAKALSDTPERPDLYRFVHKGLRALLHDVLLQVGRMDVDDEAEVNEALARVHELLTICRIHLQEENRFIHTALEARRAGAAARASDHASMNGPSKNWNSMRARLRTVSPRHVPRPRPGSTGIWHCLSPTTSNTCMSRKPS